ncbi:hypothetical protein [Aurantiacibacter marinus]|uniref:NADH dehydrogenase n=1 Tax=Aurantiacibacter marinus TaxID=874156 RepID=A0A0H0XN34_9SPHN|nr:hypothetical protein [Aurantiacibacter marinus]KLI63411.1 hypothetical protein AAV99_06370 [Aurantiacibacter marinus]
MPELLQQYWILAVLALLIGVLVAWWIFHASRRTKVELEDKPQDGGTAKRNQALIDAQPAAAAAGPITAAANSDAVAAASADADAEAGAAVPAREAIRKMADVTPEQSAEAETETEVQAQSPATRTDNPIASSNDDLRRIKGVGPKLVTILSDHGVTSFAQIAAWTDADIDRIDAELGRFQGRIRRDDWVAQARFLKSDDIAGYEERFGKV